MSFYQRVIFPRLMNWGMDSPSWNAYRTEALHNVTGRVLEVGFGTGINVDFYPDDVDQLLGIDLNPGMSPLAERRMENAAFPIEQRQADARALPFEDASFDHVVSTWTLCSIPEAEQALSEAHRVLRPGGRFVFIEHGLSPDPSVRKWQNRITGPLYKRLAGGCHLNRDMRALVGGPPWAIDVLEEFYADGAPKVSGYLYQGVATKDQGPTDDGKSA